MILRTEIKHPPFPFKIQYNHQLMFMGSCFSEHIGDFFSKHQFKVYNNPFGILFNPESILEALRLSLHEISYTDRYHYYHLEQWVSWAHHGKFSNGDKEMFLKEITEQIAKTSNWLLNTDYLFITFGTAYYYRYTANQQIVANCHKVNNNLFEKERIALHDVTARYKAILNLLFEKNPKMKVILTVSPVRHLGEGFHQNQVSKSLLHLLVDELVDDKNVFYYPSYEIMMDDLRDYRFYAHDYCHPNDLAIKYIKEKIRSVFLDEATQQKMDAIAKQNRLQAHIPQKEYREKNKNNEVAF